MQTEVKPIPEGYHSITPYLIVKDASKAIDFYKRAFDARELFRMDAPGGKVGHCELQIGDSRIMMADEFPEIGSTAPTEGGRAFSLMIYVDNADEFFDRAIDNGARILKPLKDQFYGDRMGTLQDPFGHNWHVATHIEDVPEEEMQKRAEESWKNAQ